MKASYTAGSYYRRFRGSYASQMNRQTVANNVSAINSYGTSVFSTKQSQSEGLNEMIVKKVAERLTAQAKEKLQNAAGMQTLAGLGAFTDSSA